MSATRCSITAASEGGATTTSLGGVPSPFSAPGSGGWRRHGASSTPPSTGAWRRSHGTRRGPTWRPTWPRPPSPLVTVAEPNGSAARCRQLPGGSRLLDHVAETVDLHALVGQPGDGPVDIRWLAAQLAHDPAHRLLDIGPPDVGQHVELAHEAPQQRLLDELLREG